MSLLLRSRAIGVLLIVVLLVLWELSARLRWVDSPLWPTFSAVLVALWEQLTRDQLLHHVLATLQRMFIGYGIAGALGVGLGLLMGYYGFFYRLLEPLTEALRPVPSPAYIPIAILFLGIEDEMKIFVVALGCLFPILLNTYSG